MAQRLSPSPLVKKTKRAALCFLTLFAFSACEIVDDQRIANIQDSAAVNPIPAKREFERNNMRHKVLLGVIDSGVDYDHPAIANNIHFELDAATGTPRRLGYDYTGEDQWPSPYVARTALYDPNVNGNDLSSAAEDFGLIKNILAKGPELADYLNLSRQVNQEMASGAYHGTHVAGLMVYDRPDFGLLAYRVLPHNKDADPKHDYTSEVIQKMVDAIEKAAEDGVRVVNMSLGITIQKAILEDDGAASVLKYANLILLKAALTKAVASHPEIVFVVAAGNDSSWNDGDNLTGMPCGIKADNVICVGALRDNGQPTTFTNLIISGVDVVFALGHNVISTVPTKMCVKTAMQNLGQVGMFGVDPMTDYQALADELKKECFTDPGFAPLSGTSMASPLVAHIAAEIAVKHPEYSGMELVQAIIRSANPSFIGLAPIRKLKIKKPSWYAKPSLENYSQPHIDAIKTDLLGTMSGRSFMSPSFESETVETGYWEAVVNTKRAEEGAVTK